MKTGDRFQIRTDIPRGMDALPDFRGMKGTIIRTVGADTQPATAEYDAVLDSGDSVRVSARAIIPLCMNNGCENPMDRDGLLCTACDRVALDRAFD